MQTLFIWPGEPTTPGHRVDLHWCDGNGPLCGALSYSTTTPRPKAATSGTVTCPACVRLRELREAESVPHPNMP